LVRGLYTSASGALTAQAQADTIANNLANVDTAGFKRALLQVASAPTMDVYRLQNDPGTLNGKATPGVPASQYVGSLGTGSQVMDSPSVFEQGTMDRTGNALDFAVQGNAFFAIQTGAGVRYTRDGQFARDPQGYLVTQDGNRVLGQNGPVRLPAGDFQVRSDGTIAQNNNVVDRFRLVQFANLTNVRPEGDNHFVALPGSGPVPNTTSTVMQGALERSNANVVRSMVDLITAQRWFEANQKSIQTQDEATSLAVSQVGHNQ
jgi:flagellar basal-body rod protein FlgG